MRQLIINAYVTIFRGRGWDLVRATEEAIHRAECDTFGLNRQELRVHLRQLRAGVLS